MLTLDTSSAQFTTVDGTSREITTTMLAQETYAVTTTTNALLKQGTAKRVTVVAQADMTDGDTLTISINGKDVVYEFDKTGNGVATGNVAVDISAASTAADVAAALVAEIDVAQTVLEVTDNADGTIDIVAPSLQMVITENVAHASFAVAARAITASAADGNTIVAAGQTVCLRGRHGAQVAIVQVSAGGSATASRVISGTR